MNYRNKELNNIIYIKGIKSLLYSENKTFNDNKNLMDKYSEYLAGDFIHALKKSKVDELNFSTAVNLFLLSYNNYRYFYN